METIVSNESTAIRVFFFLWTGAECKQGKPQCGATAPTPVNFLEKQKIFLHERFWGGEVTKMTWNRAQKSWRGEAVKLRNTVACRVLEGGGLKHALEW